MKILPHISGNLGCHLSGQNNHANLDILLLKEANIPQHTKRENNAMLNISWAGTELGLATHLSHASGRALQSRNLGDLDFAAVFVGSEHGSRPDLEFCAIWALTAPPGALSMPPPSAHCPCVRIVSPILSKACIPLCAIAFISAQRWLNYWCRV